MPKYKVTFTSEVEIEAVDDASAEQCAQAMLDDGDLGGAPKFEIEDLDAPKEDPEKDAA